MLKQRQDAQKTTSSLFCFHCPFFNTSLLVKQEENSLLRIQNDELDARLQQSEALLLRVKEELARYRAAGGKKPSVDFDEEEQLKRRLEVCALLLL